MLKWNVHVIMETLYVILQQILWIVLFSKPPSPPEAREIHIAIKIYANL